MVQEQYGIVQVWNLMLTPATIIFSHEAIKSQQKRFTGIQLEYSF